VQEEVRFCVTCYNVAEAEQCRICRDPRRVDDVLCVVEEPKDVVAIERTREFRGRYHVLGGAISPIDGVGPDDLRVKELMTRLMDGAVTELIIATDPNLEGEATAAYLARLGLAHGAGGLAAGQWPAGGRRPRVRRRGHAGPGVRGAAAASTPDGPPHAPTASGRAVGVAGPSSRLSVTMVIQTSPGSDPAPRVLTSVDALAPAAPPSGAHPAHEAEKAGLRDAASPHRALRRLRGGPDRRHPVRLRLQRPGLRSARRRRRAEQTGGTLVFGAAGDPAMFDPAFASDGETFRVARQIHEGLLTNEIGGTEPVPQLAEDYEVSEDGLEYTFTLREGVKFHDGTDFNAEAVCFNFERWYNFEGLAQSPSASSYYQDVFGGFASTPRRRTSTPAARRPTSRRRSSR
jgi:hypothetical protein